MDFAFFKLCKWFLYDSTWINLNVYFHLCAYDFVAIWLSPHFFVIFFKMFYSSLFFLYILIFSILIFFLFLNNLKYFLSLKLNRNLLTFNFSIFYFSFSKSVEFIFFYNQIISFYANAVNEKPKLGYIYSSIFYITSFISPLLRTFCLIT